MNALDYLNKHIDTAQQIRGETMKQTIIYRQIKELKPYKKNAKKHPKQQVERIANSIREFGFTQPVIVDKDLNVVAGHGRVLGAKKAGVLSVPTICLDNLSKEQIKAYRIADNKLNESDWDMVMLDDELSELLESDIDMELFGFDDILTDEELEDGIEKEVSFRVKEKHNIVIGCKDGNQLKHVHKIINNALKEFEVVIEVIER